MPMNMNRLTGIIVSAALLMSGAGWAADRQESCQDDLAKAFASPPREAQAWCYWWWLNGAAGKEGITRDFEEMRKQGINGALLFDAGFVACDTALTKTLGQAP